MKSKTLCFLVAVACSINAYSATYSTDFNAFTAGLDVAGQDGWTINDTASVSDVIGWTLNGTTTNAAGLGFAATGYMPTLPTIDLSHSFVEPILNAQNGGVAASFDMAIFGSSDPTHPARDTFGFSLTSTGTNVFSVVFTPSIVVPDAWAISYTVGADPSVNAHLGVVQDTAQSFHLSFTPGVGTTNYSLQIGDGNWTGTTSLAPSTVIDKFSMVWQPTDGPANAGSNGLAIDNLVLVPETSASLMLSLGGIGLACRRRRSA